MKLKVLLSVTLATGVLLAFGSPTLAESARLKSDTPLYLASTGNPTNFGTANEGEIVEVLERNGKRILILLPDGRKAWVRHSFLDYDYLDYEEETDVDLFDGPEDDDDEGDAFDQNISLVDGFGDASDTAFDQDVGLIDGFGGESNTDEGGAFDQNTSIIHGFGS